MKTIFLVSLILTTISCKAQSPIVPLVDFIDPQVNNAYFKDTQDNFLAFLGEWQFTSGNRFFKMKLIKKTMYYNDLSKYYQDLIIGEYIYKENNVEIVNTLNTLSNTSIDPYERNIVGCQLLDVNDVPSCPECNPSEIRANLMFSDPNRDILGLFGRIELRRIDENGVQKLKMTLRETGNIIIVDDQMPEFTSFNLPFGTYILTRP